MTAFVTSDLPATIDSLEKLAVWVGVCLNNLNPDLTAIEAPNISELVATAHPYAVTASGVFEWRMITRQSIKLNSNWQRAGKIWIHAQPISTTALPPDFRS